MAAMPVLEKLTDTLGDTTTSIIMTDNTARIVSRWVSDRELATCLDRSNSVVGFVHSEDVVGTNGLGTTLELGRPIRVSGGEHFLEMFHGYTCVGAPVRNPISRQIEGVIDITCRYEDTNSLLLPLILEAANSIEERLYLQASTKERLLLDHFLTAARRSARPVITLNDQIVIASPAASRLLDKADQAMLWSEAAKGVGTQGDAELPLTLRDGREMRAKCRTIRENGLVVGVIVELVVPKGRDGRGVTKGTAPQKTPSLPGLVGRSPAWLRLCELARAAAASSDPLLVTGEVGTGKLAVLDAIVSLSAEDGDAGFTVFDAALERVDGLPAWLGEVRRRLATGGGVVAIRHLEALDAVAAGALCSVIDLVDGTGPRLVGTWSSALAESDTGYAPLRDRFAVAKLDVPPLRNRLEDLPDLVAVLTRRYSSGPGSRRWTPEALKCLARMEWPGNVRQLESTVRRALATRSVGDIGLSDLPDEERLAATRRALSPLEDLERRAILAALENAHGNKVAATRALGISRSTLYRKMRAYGLRFEDFGA